MCGNCCCHESETHHEQHKHEHHMDFPFPLMDVEEEIKMLEEYRRTPNKAVGKSKQAPRSPKTLNTCKICTEAFTSHISYENLEENGK
ncbi:MAG: hypothetical protein QXZ02_05695 [Candidatus Bathyarchaeia archaeon]